MSEIDGRPAQILIDEGFRNRAPVRELPRLGWFGVYALRDPGSAFWDPEETASLDAIESDLIRLCDLFGEAGPVYVLNIAIRGIREYFVYFGRDSELSPVLPSLKAAHPDYRIEYEERIDATWSRYKTCLPKE